MRLFIRFIILAFCCFVGSCSSNLPYNKKQFPNPKPKIKPSVNNSYIKQEPKNINSKDTKKDIKKTDAFKALEDEKNFDYYKLTKNDALNLLGTPILIKKEQNFENWQYRSNLCIINFVWNNSKDSIESIRSYSPESQKKLDFKQCIIFISSENQ